MSQHRARDGRAATTRARRREKDERRHFEQLCETLSRFVDDRTGPAERMKALNDAEAILRALDRPDRQLWLALWGLDINRTGWSFQHGVLRAPSSPCAGYRCLNIAWRACGICQRPLCAACLFAEGSHACTTPP
jgi:hypothetical protein